RRRGAPSRLSRTSATTRQAIGFSLCFLLRFGPVASARVHQSENTGTIFRDLIFQPPASLRKLSWTSLTIIGFAGLPASSDRYNVRIQAASTVVSDDIDSLKLEITSLDVGPLL